MVYVASVFANAQWRDLPVYEVSRTATPINVDGKLDDLVWTKATPFRDFRRNLDGLPSPIKTDARALYDDNFLYVSIRSADSNIWSSSNFRESAKSLPNCAVNDEGRRKVTN